MSFGQDSSYQNDTAGKNRIASDETVVNLASQDILFDVAALDLPNARASQATYDYFQNIQNTQQFPILDSIVASQNLRMRQVEDGAKSGQLNDFSTSVGKRFLGVVGEALVWRALKYQSASPVGTELTYVFPQPVTLARQGVDLPDEIDRISRVWGSQEPDMATIMIGGKWRVGPLRFQVSPQLSNIVSTGNVNRAESATYRANTLISLAEITTSRQYEHIRERAVTVATYSTALRAANLNLPGVEVVPLLIIDRGAYFQLSDAQKAHITSLVHSAGGRIMVLRDLTQTAIHNVNVITQDLQRIHGINRSQIQQQGGSFIAQESININQGDVQEFRVIHSERTREFQSINLSQLQQTYKQYAELVRPTLATGAKPLNQDQAIAYALSRSGFTPGQRAQIIAAGSDNIPGNRTQAHAYVQQTANWPEQRTQQPVQIAQRQQ
jgi:hypothetical protein